MVKNLNSAEAVFRELGGVPGVARLLGYSTKRVWNWKAAGQFPAHTFAALTAELRRHGKSAPADLWGMKELAS